MYTRYTIEFKAERATDIKFLNPIFASSIVSLTHRSDIL
jgi:hypothetical protein